MFSQHIHEAPNPFRARGVDVSAELEAVVMSCLDKDPSRRPQTAVALRDRLEACVVDRWEATHTDAWWRAHQPRLDGDDKDIAPTTHTHRTLAVDEGARLS